MTHHVPASDRNDGSAQKPPHEPRVLGDFVLGELLGEGGFGTVYRAEQRGLGRPAVVKLIRQSLLERRDSAERFLQEARLASRFDHPYAAHVYAFGTEPDGSMWIAMELVNGTPLDELLERSGPIPIERFVPLMERLCEVIQSAHDQHIVHRDIKPSNVMVIARAGRLMPKLLDFGIAKSLVAPSLPTTSLSPRAKRPSAVRRLGLEHTMDASTNGDGTATDATLDVASQSATDDTLASAESSSVATDQTMAGTGSVPRTHSASLTRAGQILGSPPYMAPEQWLDAGQVGPWTDQYALALLAFEAITGTRAFSGSSLSALMDAHENAPLPPLPAHVPPALHAVLARAAAKRPADRYPSLTELATAFRAAALDGAAAADDGPPITLPAELRSQWMADAPQPIAEAIAALVATRAPSKLVERVRGVAILLARWLGVASLACQSRIGRVTPGTEAHELVLAVRRRSLHDREWLELAAALCRPFADRPEAWPLPELARFATGPAFARIVELVSDDAPMHEVTDSAARRLATQRVEALARVLDDLAWVLDYAIARATPDALELWMGLPPRGPDEERPRMPPLGSTSTNDIVVLDADGAPAVRLSPLVHVARPLPGEPEELFVFVGPSRTGDGGLARSSPRGFERDDVHVWSWFAKHLLDAGAGESLRIDDERCPYPGLLAFTADDRAFFVGREREVEELVNRLRAQPIAAVVGPSGVGKSSFIAAGVVPALPPSWRAEIIRPGGDPVGALKAIVARAESSPYRDTLDRTTTDDPSTLGDELAAIARRQGAPIVVVVDQAEELFTMCASEAAREAFAQALTSATSHGDVRVVLSLRDDFLCRADELPAWRGVLAHGVQVLRVPQPADLERMIRVPARRAGYDFDDAKLPAAIVAEVADQAGALPLVAFAAAELWERRDRHFKRLTRAAYDQIGGVTGAIVQHADGVVDQLPAPDRRLVRLAFRRLLTAEGTRASIGRTELVAAIGGGAEGQRVIDRLLAARLVVSRDADDGERVEIIHETLVHTWPRLATWRQEDAASTKIHERLAAAARHWEERHRAPALLWRGTALDDLRRLRREDVALSPTEQAFTSASELAAARARRRRIATVAAAFGVLALGTVGLAWANRRISGQRQAAVARLAASFEERARLALDEGDAKQAALYLAESRRLGGATSEGSHLLVAHAAAALEARTGIVGHTVSPIVYSSLDRDTILAAATDGKLRAWQPDGRSTVIADDVLRATRVGDAAVALDKRGALVAYDLRGQQRWRVDGAVASGALELDAIGNTRGDVVLSVGGRARLWKLSDGTPRGELGNGAITVAALDSTGAFAATGDGTGAVQVWDLATLREVGRCPAHGSLVDQVMFSSDGRFIVSGGRDREIHVCDRTTGTATHRFTGGHRSKLNALALTADHGMLVSAARDGSVAIWNLTTGAMQATMTHGAAVTAVVLSPDQREVLTLGRDGNGRLWDRDSGAAIGSLQGHVGLVSAARWSGDEIVTTSLDGSIRRWSAERARRSHVRTHGAPVLDLDVAGDLALTAGSDGRLLVWNHRTRALVATLSHAAPVVAARFSLDGQRVVTVDGTGAASIWSTGDGSKRATLAASKVTTATVLADGTIATGDAGNALRLWRADGSELARIEMGFVPVLLTADPTGRWLAVAPDYERFDKIAMVDVPSRTIATRLDSEPRNTVIFDSTRLAMTRGSAIDVLELGTWKRLARLEGHKGKTIEAWFLRDGRILSSADDAQLLLWSKEGVLERALETSGDTMYEVQQSADGSILAAIGYDGALRVFDAHSMERLLALPGHRGFTVLLGFAGNDTVVTGGSDGRAIFWDVRRPARPTADLATLVRCHVPLRLEGDVAMPRELDLSDPTCHGAAPAK